METRYLYKSTRSKLQNVINESRGDMPGLALVLAPA